MANTLRRKMFKLGGRANTHGVGITSGLKMKKGEAVQASIGAGSGNQPMKMGPDGKMREGHMLPLLGLGGAGGAILGSLGRTALGRILPNFLKRKADPRGIMGFLRGDPITKRMMGKGLPGVAPKAYDIITKVPSTTAGAKALRAAQLATAPTGLVLQEQG